MLGDIIKELRKKKGLTAASFAKILGVPTATYNNYEDGTSKPKYEKLLQIADFYEVSTDYLLGRVDEPQSEDLSDFLKEMQLDSATRAIICAFAELDRDQREVFIKTMKELSQEEPQIVKVAVKWFEKLSVHKVSAGSGYDLSSGDQWQGADLEDVPELALADFAVEVDGDSMQPTIMNGDVVLVQADAEVGIGDIGLFFYDGCGYVKERGEEGLISHNPKYGIIKPTSEVKCFGKVIGKTRKI